MALPLTGVKVVEFAGLAPGPMTGMILADFGANVVRVDRPSPSSPSPDVLCRGKRSIAIDPKTPSGLTAVRKLIDQADVLIDPFRPGVTERLGLGPEVFLGNQTAGKEGSNKKLIFARLVGFTRTGPYKTMAGHDLNYLALSGVLSMFPGEEKPDFPLNILGDFAGGGLMCAMGILFALIERSKSGRGQIVHTDMVSLGSAIPLDFPLLLTQFPGSSYFSERRGTNVLDGGAPFYNVYTCADGHWMSVACLEPQFFRVFLERFCAALPSDFALDDGWKPSGVEVQNDKSAWLRLKEYFEKGFKLFPRDHWTNIFHGTDACAVPVLSVSEAASLASADASTLGPTPHPQLSRTPALPAHCASIEGLHNILLERGAHTEEVLDELGLSVGEKRRLVDDGALGKGLAKL
ncbi:Alpha-methylacyl-CoA racemase [Grifola frondosa]|uniref:Alpha-methylacyl-CoA racemase n=1 Tax=Grifola frondosa TaxID=5627 RepID=A0A1C7MBY6_GRIFR|nr:Alpha-methylacyl-CoA racemase [Grifola frondosa]